MEIVEFRSAHAEAFRTLNEAWISKHFVLEPKDREVLEDPQGRSSPGAGGSSWRSRTAGPSAARRC
jgi:hypothetical protein